MNATERDRRIRLAIITGLSGSGKSTVAKCFEDLGYYCVDNLPLSLLGSFLSDPTGHIDSDEIAVVTDVRAPGFATELPQLIQRIDRRSVETTLLFLEASDEILVRRFSETRRRHPVAGDGRVIRGIQQERELLAHLRQLADLIFDTSEWSMHEIRSQVYRRFGPNGVAGMVMTVAVVSFGFKHGIPYGTDLLFDVRYLANPHFVPGLREQTGQDPDVLEFLEAEQDFSELIERLKDLLIYLLPRFRRENRSYLTVAVGCTGGRHRSVAVSERLAHELRQADWNVQLQHRDVAR